MSKIDATCTSPSTEFYRCACGETKTEHAVDIIEHSLSKENKENIVESTCLDSGSYDSVFYCTMCGAEISRKNIVIEPLGHEFVDGYCVRCNKPEHTHIPGEAVTENIVFTVENVAGSYESVVYCTDCGEELSRETKKFTNATVNYTYTGKTQIFEAPIDGDYKLEVWGAQGGSSSGGRGAYVTGIVNLKKGEILYVNVGAQPSGGGGGWNGGGTNRSNNYGGGGATDIALYGTKDTTSWNTSDHLYSRIIVAGAGGGYNGEGGNGGGYGGFTSGGHGSGNEPGYGASISGGGATNRSSNCVESPTNGSFGIGGTNAWCGERLGAGGGGWYGGGAGGGGNNNGSGGGGSSYAWCASYASYMPNSSYKPSTNYYLSSVSGSSNTNTGHGKAKITLVSK